MAVKPFGNRHQRNVMFQANLSLNPSALLPGASLPPRRAGTGAGGTLEEAASFDDPVKIPVLQSVSKVSLFYLKVTSYYQATMRTFCLSSLLGSIHCCKKKVNSSPGQYALGKP